MKLRHLLSFVLAFLTLALAVQIAMAWPPDWKGEAETQEFPHLLIKYTYNSIEHPDSAVTHAHAILLGNDLEHAWQKFIHWGFNPPTEKRGEKVSAWIVEPADMTCKTMPAGCAPRTNNRIELAPGAIRKPGGGQRSTPTHELFHREQFTYIVDDVHGWSEEGTATAAQDAVFWTVDNHPNSHYLGRVNSYLLNLPGLERIAYRAALFWKYFVEQVGTFPAMDDNPYDHEAGEHMNALVWFYRNADRNNNDKVDDPKDIVDRVLKKYRPDLKEKTFSALFFNFVVANFTKDYGGVTDPRFYYQDERDLEIMEGKRYAKVRIDHSQDLNSDNPEWITGGSVGAWQSSYHVAKPDITCPFIYASMNSSFVYDPRNPNIMRSNSIFYSFLATRGNKVFFYNNPGYRTYGTSLTKTFYNDNYDQIVAISAGGLYESGFSVYIACNNPKMEILVPTSKSPAAVGDLYFNKPFTVRLKLTGGAFSFAGADADNFEVTIGGKPAQIMDARNIKNEYWLLINPPTMSAAGKYDLTVTLKGSDPQTQNNAVIYDPDYHYDHVLVIDNTGSMAEPDSYPKILAARNAAKLYVDELELGQRLGVVSITNTGITEYPLHTIDSAGDRHTAKETIDGLYGTGDHRSIGAGLLQALHEFSVLDDPSNPNLIILISDGHEEIPPYWEDVKAEVLASGIPVHTIGLGPDADQELLMEIANYTYGEYTFLEIPIAGQGGPDPSPASDYQIDTESGMAQFLGVDGLALPDVQRQENAENESLGIYRLVKIYDALALKFNNRYRTYFNEGAIKEDDRPYYWHIKVDRYLETAVIAVAHEQESSLDKACGIKRELILKSPGNVEHSPTRSDAYHDVFEISSPQKGTWSLSIRMIEQPPCGPIVLGNRNESRYSWGVPYNVQVMVSGESQIFTASAIDFTSSLTGSSVTLHAYMNDGVQMVSGAAITAKVSGCGFSYPITLLDNGLHSDGIAGDGIYGAYFTQTTCAGSYSVEVEGVYEDAIRLTSGDFVIEQDVDSDGDGLPDNWETKHGLNPNMNDARQDPDLDALPNIVEYLLGTSPISDDTDGGGEADISEILWGQDAINDPLDDVVNPPGDIVIVPGTGQNEIYFEIDPQYAGLGVLVTHTPNPPFRISRFTFVRNTGSYTHVGLDNDHTYYYRFITGTPILRIFNRPRRHISGYASVQNATPKTDPYPPGGHVLINDDDDTTSSLDVILSLWATNDTVNMMISNNSTFEGAIWETYASSKSWRLEGAPGDAGFVYVKLIDSAGNINDTLMDGIMIE